MQSSIYISKMYPKWEMEIPKKLFSGDSYIKKKKKKQKLPLSWI